MASDKPEANWAERIEKACKTKLVIAGGRREFLVWCRQRNQFQIGRAHV